MTGSAHRVRPCVAVAGPGRATEAEAELAREVGALLARRGAVVVCGGLGGVMAACAEGAAAEGGVVVGLLPGRDRAAGNRHLTVAVATGLGELRNGVLVTTCDALIAVGGSWGTLSEIALALRAGRPVALLRGWPLDGAGFADEAHRPVVVSTPAEAVAAVLGPG
ncbi:TIGR00725 family protein [Streptomyces echinoruber]|uniref:TIGR00725 family protein n=1 Tax=Streptomyces echinoruber TaxID=68898 RepID=A0A918RZQ4_9ACTN|nr:TIGR00725 family protein [Streptomyces echinoruber]GHA17699.1 TIGR00725 family protein [Streptomyces echinoruber]